MKLKDIFKNKDNNKNVKNKSNYKKKDKIKFKEKIKSLKNKLNKFMIFERDRDSMYSFKEVVVIMFFSLGLGFFACLSFVKIFNNGRSYMALSNDLSKFVDTYYAIKDNYYGELDNEKLVDSAIKGMISAIGDEYTSYSDTDDADNFKQTVSGIYEGIGCTVGVNLDNKIVVVDMFKDSPAEKAGLKVGDIIIKIDGEDFVGKSSTDMSNYVKFSKNSKVVLTIIRDEETMELDVERKKIEIPYVSGEVITKDDMKIGYIDISLFSSTIYDQFKRELEELEKENISGLVIDVRGNSGGYLSGVTDILNLFLKKGDVIYQLESGNKKQIKKDTTKEKRDYPVAVLVNGGSASASEILASVIKESYNGYVVGTKTYGKGTVQQTTTLPDGSMVKYTVQKWLTPNGNWVNEVGVEPTDTVELDISYAENPIMENDNQLQKALELVTKK
ncbi:MAG: S41 family peptidase [Bacilli bacterium]|nr:S41 family peptidase [Bacilli bacterium]